MRDYDTLLDALNDLKERGYTFDFKLQYDCLECAETGKLDPRQFEITEVYRFEGMTNPDDSAVLYAIEGRQGEKGTLVDAYGAYASPLSADMIEKLRITH
ncbi:MAG: phosphoribosylpyrophosphate synthetase [Lewinellaceae bacterium]|nr:phosphoribosylpyrophosphate synthetase [Saprospiraceae bacterium]MCB9337770.1 phosphoribosylpyrophosphate synthetase [Lewinellaceae bacterium]